MVLTFTGMHPIHEAVTSMHINIKKIYNHWAIVSMANTKTIKKELPNAWLPPPFSKARKILLLKVD
jgi:hypothetical protein